MYPQSSPMLHDVRKSGSSPPIARRDRALRLSFLIATRPAFRISKARRSSRSLASVLALVPIRMAPAASSRFRTCDPRAGVYVAGNAHGAVVLTPDDCERQPLPRPLLGQRIVDEVVGISTARGPGVRGTRRQPGRLSRLILLTTKRPPLAVQEPRMC